MRAIDGDVLLDKVIEQYCKDCDKRKAIKSGNGKLSMKSVTLLVERVEWEM